MTGIRDLFSRQLALARRPFMVRSAAFAGLGTSLAACEQEDALARELAHLLQGAPSVREAAIAYLTANPSDQDFSLLKQNLVWAQECRTRQELASELDKRRQSDFSKGDVYYLEGWLLSRTEARLFVYAYKSGLLDKMV